MNVCGVIIRAAPDRMAELRSALTRIAGVELHAGAADGRLVVTIEDTPTHTAADALATVQAAPGVLACFLIYHQFEPDAAAPAAGGMET